MKRPRSQAGSTLIEVVVVSAIVSLFFWGLFGGVNYSLRLIANSREQISALAVATQEIEYIRSLSYDAVGTVLGIPSGLIPQVSTTSLNGIEFERRVLVQYIDDSADGVGAADSNGITTDYKQAKVTVRWTSREVSKEMFLITNIIPRSIETSVGGGTLRVNVFDADVQGLSGASVRVVNNTVIPNIDITKSTDISGTALFGGAPAGPNYEIYVTRSGYSSDQTYVATTSLPNPSTLPVAVLEADISTMNFFIDELSTYTIRTLGDQVIQVAEESFDDWSGVATSTQVDLVAGKAVLRSVAGVYDSNGTLFLNAISPTSIVKWTTASLVGSVPFNTSAVVRFYSSTSTASLLPDTDLPGNSAGFSSTDIDISMVDPIAYPSLVPGIQFTSSDSATSTSVESLSVSYVESETPVNAVTLDVVGAKTIGTDSGGGPVYKNTSTVITSAGEYEFTDVEWDDYTVSPSGYDIAVACPSNPAVINPGGNHTQELLLVTNSTHTLRVVVETAAGDPITNAQVNLSRTGFSDTQDSRNCGQTFFGSLATAADYQIVVSVPGEVTQTLTAVEIQDDEVIVVQF